MPVPPIAELRASKYWALAVVSSGMTLWAFDLSLPWTAPMVVLVFASFAVTLPSSPGFVGTYHYFVALSLRVMGVPAARAASFAFLVHAAGVLPYTLISVLLLIPDALRGDLVPATATATSSPAPSASSDSDVSASP